MTIEKKTFYLVETTFTWKGQFEVDAENEEQAKQIVEEKCGVNSSGIFSNPSESVLGWRFPYPIQKEIGEATRIEYEEDDEEVSRWNEMQKEERQKRGEQMETTNAVKKLDHVNILRSTIESVKRINERIRTRPHPRTLHIWIGMRDAELAFLLREMEYSAHVEGFDEIREAVNSLLEND